MVGRNSTSFFPANASKGVSANSSGSSSNRWLRECSRHVHVMLASQGGENVQFDQVEERCGASIKET
jgi:hypothetical protein